MGNFDINNGAVGTNKRNLASIDYRYGPYDSIAAAHAALRANGLNAVGLTVGIRVDSDTIKEYWYQGGTGEINLVEKLNADPDAAIIGDDYSSAVLPEVSANDVLLKTDQSLTPQDKEQVVANILDKTYGESSFGGKGKNHLRKNLQTVALPFDGTTESDVETSSSLDTAPTSIIWCVPQHRFLAQYAYNDYYVEWPDDDGYKNLTDSSIFYIVLSEQIRRYYQYNPASQTLVSIPVDFKYNVLTQTMVSDANTIYIIDKDYNLNNATLTIPAGCTLQFDGGSISNGTLVCNNTLLVGDVKISNINGTISNKIAYASWFTNMENNDLKCLSDSGTVFHVDKDVTLEGGTLVLNSLEIDGDKEHAINNAPKIQFEGELLSIKNVRIRPSSSTDSFLFVDGNERACKISLHNLQFDGRYNGTVSCNRFISRQATQSVSIATELDVSFCEIHHVKEFGIKYSDVCSGRIADNVFHHIGAFSANNNNTAISLGTTYNAIRLCNNMVVENNVFRDLICPYTTLDESKEAHAILMYGDYNVISNNTIDGIVSSNTDLDPGSESEGIYIKGSYNVIRDNYVKYANGGVGSDGAITVKHVDGVTHIATGNIVEGNTIYIRQGIGITLYGNDSTICRNYIVQKDNVPGNKGASVSGISLSYTNNTVISDNIFIDDITINTEEAYTSLNSSLFLALNTTAGETIVKNNSIKCLTIAAAYNDYKTIFDGNNIHVKNSTNTNKYKTLIHSKYISNQQGSEAPPIMPLVVLMNNVITVEDNNFTALITTNANIDLVGNRWTFKNSTTGGFVRSYKEVYYVVDGTSVAVDGVLNSTNEVYEIGENISDFSVYLESASYVIDIDNPYYKPTNVVKSLTIGKKVNFNNVRAYIGNENQSYKQYGTNSEKPNLTVSDVLETGRSFFSTEYTKPQFFDGANNRWVWSDGAGITANQKGGVSSRPSASDVYFGYRYVDIEIQKNIVAYINGDAISWRDMNGYTPIQPWGTTEYRNSLINNDETSDVFDWYDEGLCIYDTTLKKPFFLDVRGDSVHGYTFKWLESDGVAVRTGTKDERPSGGDIYVGFQYMQVDTTYGTFPIWASEISGNTVTWVKSDGSDPDAV